MDGRIESAGTGHRLSEGTVTVLGIQGGTLEPKQKIGKSDINLTV